MLKLEELRRSLQIQKTYLYNINQQLLKPEYQNEAMRKLKQDVSLNVNALEHSLSFQEHELKIKVAKIILKLTSTDSI